MKQNQEDEKTLSRRQVSSSTEVDSLAERFKREFFLMSGLNSIVYEDIFYGSWKVAHLTT